MVFYYYLAIYLLIGIGFNAIHDCIISYLKQEENRFNFIERCVFGLIWPFYLILFIINLIIAIINGPDQDN
jgi:hypothetical protein